MEPPATEAPGEVEENVFLTVVMPIIGNILAVAMVLAPMPAVIGAMRAKNLGPLNIYPQALLLINNTCWIAFAVSIPDVMVFVPNVWGVICCTFYTLVCLDYAGDKQRRNIKIILITGISALLLVGGVAAFGITDAATRSLVLGFTCNIALLCFFSSPMMELARVIRTRNAAVFSIPITVASTLNGAAWTLYGLGRQSPFIYVPNGVGAVVGIVQLSMIALFWRNRSNVAPANAAVLSHTASEAKGLVIAAAEEEKDLVIAEDEDAVLQLRVSPGARV